MKRYAIVSPRYPTGGAIGGAETLLRNLAEYLVRQGNQVDFLTTCARNHFSWENSLPPGEEVINGLRIQYFEVNEDRDVLTFLTIQERISNGEKISIEDQECWNANNVNSENLYEYLRQEGAQYDAILMGPYLFGLTINAARIHPDRTHLVPCLHDECFAYLDIMNPMFHAVKSILFNARPEKELAMRLYGIPAEKGHVVGMGMTPFASDPEAFRRQYELDTPYVVYCGRREGLKGTPLMTNYLHTFRERTGRDIKLVLTGSGTIEAPDEMQPHMIDLGFVSEADKHRALAGASVFIHPSVNESFGIVLLESWLAGTPALVHGMGEVLPWQCRQSNGGFWFRNYPEFETMLLRLLDDDALRQHMGASGKHYVETEYSWDTVGAKLTAALEA